MNTLHSYIRQLKRSRVVFVVIGVIVLAILVGAYVDLKMSIPRVVIEGEELISTSTTSEVATTTDEIIAPPATIHYENAVYGYSLDYSDFLDTSDTQHKAVNDYDGIIPGSLFAASFPEGYGAGTNLSSASVFAGVRDVKENACYGTIYGNSATTSSRIPPLTVTIGDVKYSVGSVVDAAAGSSYVTTRYSTMHEGRCYNVSMVTHSFNDIETANADHPDMPIQRYNQSEFDSILDQLMLTFEFTQ